MPYSREIRRSASFYCIYSTRTRYRTFIGLRVPFMVGVGNSPTKNDEMNEMTKSASGVKCEPFC